MRRFFRAAGWAILVIAGIIVIAVAWLADIKPLQYAIIGGGTLLAVGWHIQQWQDQQARRYADLSHRLAEIERALNDIRRRLPH